MSATTVPATTISVGKQDVDYKQYYVLDGLRLRIDISSNAYAFQSYATVKVWRPDALDWSYVPSIHYADMKTPVGLYNDPKPRSAWPSYFQADADELKRLAKFILGGRPGVI